jgi:hypothetical protein
MAEQGFVKELNFQEVVRAGQASSLFINLSRIDGITDDIQLFSNNLSNFSKIPPEVYSTELDADNEYVIILDLVTYDGYFPYSNRTALFEEDPVTGAARQFTQAEAQALVDNSIIESINEALNSIIRFTVYEANGQDRFKVKDQYGINRDVTGNLIRKDSITFRNLNNMAVDREQVIEDAITTNDDGDVSSAENSGFISAAISANYSEINNGLSLFRYKESRLPLGYKESFLTKPGVVNGYINISNPDNISVTNESLNPPGLYIRPPSGGNAIRAFSDTSNPWTRNNSTSRIETDASQITIQKFVLDTPNLQPSSSADQHQSEVNDLTGDDNYKIKVEINGVPYFLFAKQG